MTEYAAIAEWLRERYTESDGYIYTIKDSEPTTYGKLKKAFAERYGV